jgi:hypothetical protein
MVTKTPKPKDPSSHSDSDSDSDMSIIASPTPNAVLITPSSVIASPNPMPVDEFEVMSSASETFTDAEVTDSDMRSEISVGSDSTLDAGDRYYTSSEFLLDPAFTWADVNIGQLDESALGESIFGEDNNTPHSVAASFELPMPMADLEEG